VPTNCVYVLTRMSQCRPTVCTHAHVSVLTNCVYSRARLSADQLCVLTRMSQCRPTVSSRARLSADQLCVLTRMSQCRPTLCTHAHVSVPTNCVYLSSTSFRLTTNIQFPLLFIAALGIMNSVLVGHSWLLAACRRFLCPECCGLLLPKEPSAFERVYLFITQQILTSER
jgi:hypothetical protein